MSLSPELNVRVQAQDQTCSHGSKRTLGEIRTSTARTEQDSPGHLDNTCKSIQPSVWLMQEGERGPYVCPFTFWNGTDTLHQTHSPSVTVLQMTDEGRTEDMDPSPILGGLGCSEKGRVFGTSFAVCWHFGAHSASGILGHHHWSGDLCISAGLLTIFDISDSSFVQISQVQSAVASSGAIPTQPGTQSSACHQLENHRPTGVNSEVTRGTLDHLTLWSDALAKRAH